MLSQYGEFVVPVRTRSTTLIEEPARANEAAW